MGTTKTRLNLNVPAGTHKAMKVAAAQDGVTMTTLIETAVERFTSLTVKARQRAYRVGSSSWFSTHGTTERSPGHP